MYVRFQHRGPPLLASKLDRVGTRDTKTALFLPLGRGRGKAHSPNDINKVVFLDLLHRWCRAASVQKLRNLHPNISPLKRDDSCSQRGALFSTPPNVECMDMRSERVSRCAPVSATSTDFPDGVTSSAIGCACIVFRGYVTIPYLAARVQNIQPPQAARQLPLSDGVRIEQRTRTHTRGVARVMQVASAVPGPLPAASGWLAIDG